ncbi:MAG TPA: PEP-CTERM sorting domain-containing protein [Gemmatimonadales bacterium]|jgi:hypothetical protein
MTPRLNSGLDRAAAASVAALLAALTGCNHAVPLAQNTKFAIARVLPKTDLKPVVLIPYALSWSDPGGASLLDALQGTTPARAQTPLPLINAVDGTLPPSVVAASTLQDEFGADGSRWYLAGLPMILAGSGRSGSGSTSGTTGWTNGGGGYVGGALPGSPHGGGSGVSSDFTRYGATNGDGQTVFAGQVNPGISINLAGHRAVLENTGNAGDDQGNGDGPGLGDGQGGAGDGGSNNSFLGSSFGPPSGEFFPEFASDIGMPAGSVADFSTDQNFSANDLSFDADGVSSPESGDVDLAPEPSAMMMLGLGLIGITGAKRRRRK